MVRINLSVDIRNGWSIIGSILKTLKEVGERQITKMEEWKRGVDGGRNDWLKWILHNHKEVKL